MTNDRNPGADLTDEELIERLLDHQQNGRWTVGDLIAVEDRGYDFLADYPELRTDIQDLLAKQQEQWRKAFAPSIAAFQNLQGLADKFKVKLPEFHSLPTDAFAQPLLLDSPAVRQAQSLERLEQVEATTLEILNAIANNTKRDWFQWLVFGAAVIAAATGIAALIIR